MDSQIVWLNGKFVPLAEARISPLDRGFLYGDGIFETIRAQQGTILYLEKHLERLQASALALNLTIPINDWRGILEGLLKRNGLMGLSRIKIAITRGEGQGLALQSATVPTLLVTAQSYQPPSYESGYRLHLAQDLYTTSLARHKTLNYLSSLAAKQQAFEAGADEALLLDPWGHVAEAANSALIVFRNGSWWVPQTSYRLESLTLALVAEWLGIQEIPMDPKDLDSAETLWLLNSMMGVMPVSTLGEACYKLRNAEAALIRERLFGKFPV